LQEAPVLVDTPRSIFAAWFRFSVSLWLFQVCATLGTTGACSFDNLQELGPICKCNTRQH